MKRMATFVVLMALGLIACGNGGGDQPTTTADAEGATINIEGFQFVGPETIEAGTTVKVTNLDGATHTWTSNDDIWDSGRLETDDGFEFTFDEPGEFGFFCQIHPFQMTGTITVEG